jgi:HD superfamily phosphohydrolase YqeK
MTETRRRRLFDGYRRVVTGRPAAAGAGLRHDLTSYRSSAELLDLAAALVRHDDVQAEPIRELLHWPAAA